MPAARLPKPLAPATAEQLLKGRKAGVYWEVRRFARHVAAAVRLDRQGGASFAARAEASAELRANLCACSGSAMPILTWWRRARRPWRCSRCVALFGTRWKTDGAFCRAHSPCARTHAVPAERGGPRGQARAHCRAGAGPRRARCDIRAHHLHLLMERSRLLHESRLYQSVAGRCACFCRRDHLVGDAAQLPGMPHTLPFHSSSASSSRFAPPSACSCVAAWLPQPFVEDPKLHVQFNADVRLGLDTARVRAGGCAAFV